MGKGSTKAQQLRDRLTAIELGLARRNRAYLERLDQLGDILPDMAQKQTHEDGFRRGFDQGYKACRRMNTGLRRTIAGLIVVASVLTILLVT